jgi:LysM repeat protein
MNNPNWSAPSGRTCEISPPERDGDVIVSPLCLISANLNDVRKSHSHAREFSCNSLPDLAIHEHSHTVKQGETLSEIAMRHVGKAASLHDIYAYVEKLGKFNRIQDVNRIYVGQVIHFPDEPPAPKAVPAAGRDGALPAVPAAPSVRVEPELAHPSIRVEPELAHPSIRVEPAPPAPETRPESTPEAPPTSPVAPSESQPVRAGASQAPQRESGIIGFIH